MFRRFFSPSPSATCSSSSFSSFLLSSRLFLRTSSKNTEIDTSSSPSPPPPQETSSSSSSSSSKTPIIKEKIRVGVLQPHSEGTWIADDVTCSPGIYYNNNCKNWTIKDNRKSILRRKLKRLKQRQEQLKKKGGDQKQGNGEDDEDDGDDCDLEFEEFTIRKQSAFKQLRQITSEGKCDVFWNLCDGAKDEIRTGEDTARVLESLNCAFTGADSHVFEPSKVEMKMLLAAAGIKTPNFAVLDREDIEIDSESCIEKACSHLRLPVIVKHISGYGSIGITRDSKCDTLSSLIKKVRSFIQEYDVALVEEFIVGEEGTVFVCADPTSATGVHVFPPLLVPVPGGSSDFLHYDHKWQKEGEKGSGEKTLEDAKFRKFLLPSASSQYEKDLYWKVNRMTTNAFAHILQRVGYGRVDFRIDKRTREPYFLEINPNCGIFLPDKDTKIPEKGEGDYADLMLVKDKEFGGHDAFIKNQVDIAIKQQRARVPWWIHAYSSSASCFVTKATRFVPKLTRIFGDEVRPVPVVARALYDATIPASKKSASASTSSQQQQQQQQQPAEQEENNKNEIAFSTGAKGRNKPSSSDSSSPSSSTSSSSSSSSEVKIGCAIYRGDAQQGGNTCVMLQHSCDPNCAFLHSNTIELVTVKSVEKGAALTIDYATLRDEMMPNFRCNCNSKNCRGIVKSQSWMIRKSDSGSSGKKKKKGGGGSVGGKGGNRKKKLKMKAKEEVMTSLKESNDQG